MAVAYVRVSTDRQELGPEAQQAAIEGWARAGGVRLAATIEERLSGATSLDRRPGFSAALAAAREHGAGLVVVARRDRLARDMVVAALAERAALAAGARIVSADGAGNGSSEADAFMRSVLDAASAYERALTRARTRGALAAKRARGEKTGGDAPLGFRRAVGADGVARLELEPAEQETIIRARALRADGRSYGWIARQLGAEGCATRSGRRWHETQIRRMLASGAALACDRSHFFLM